MSISFQTQEQKRAKFALAWIQERAKEKDDLQKEIKSWASQFPVMIHTNGIGQACAFFKSRNQGDPNKKLYGVFLLYKSLDCWLSSQFPDLYKTDNIKNDKPDLMSIIVSCNQQQYRLLQVESLAYLKWIKQLSKAYLKDEVTDTGNV